MFENVFSSNHTINDFTCCCGCDCCQWSCARLAVEPLRTELRFDDSAAEEDDVDVDNDDELDAVVVRAIMNNINNLVLRFDNFFHIK